MPSIVFITFHHANWRIDILSSSAVWRQDVKNSHKPVYSKYLLGCSVRMHAPWTHVDSSINYSPPYYNYFMFPILGVRSRNSMFLHKSKFIQLTWQSKKGGIIVTIGISKRDFRWHKFEIQKGGESVSSSKCCVDRHEYPWICPFAKSYTNFVRSYNKIWVTAYFNLQTLGLPFASSSTITVEMNDQWERGNVFLGLQPIYWPRSLSYTFL